MTSLPLDLHEWISFEDEEEDRTWVFDVTFLASSWRCIFGEGCSGVLTEPTPELQHGCCSYGAHFVDDDDRAHIERVAKRLTEEQWQFRKVSRKRGGPIHVDKAGDTVTRLVDDACIFLNRPDFEGGAGCALHRAALVAGERPLDWKPEVCWQLPLRRIDETDNYGHMTSTLREWKRRDWGPGGHEFHWWCTDSSDAFVGPDAVYLSMRDEIVELVGAEPYQRFVELMEQRRDTQVTLLPHPALRHGVR